MEDPISIGTIGLIKAIESYRPNKGTKLATFAARCIESEILMHLRSLKKTIKTCLSTIRLGQTKRAMKSL
ncbi:Sigma-70 region 2 [Paenibacillus algorifonticola]|uniref:Sigma-70 region 2 n=1 Tax=Paenibacillus algorifonticola TaxID=684063 RepID=A0A1I1YZD7_9BACL|nr:Sigma-70 region 2 [Paenibacillus algorifonticola]